MATIKDRIKSVPPFEPEEEREEEVASKEETKETEEPQEGVEESQEKSETQEEKPLESAKERTREQFEKLKEKNKKLSEEIKKYQDVLSSLQPQGTPQTTAFSQFFDPILTNQVPSANEYPGLSQKQIKETFDQLVDDQGFVNIDLLKEELRKRQEREIALQEEIERLRNEVKTTQKTIDDYQRTTVVKEVHKKYPQIDPESPSFNPVMWEAVRNEIIGQWTTQGKEDLEAACKKWYDILYPMGKDKQADKKAQINAIPSQSVSTSGSWEEHEDLVKATRLGKKGALAERIKRAGY